MSPASAGCADLFDHRVGERDGLALEFEATALAYARPLLNAIDGDDVKFRVLLANLERGLKFGRIAPTLQRLRAFPPKDHDRPVREVARDPRSRSCPALPPRRDLCPISEQTKGSLSGSPLGR